LLARYVDEPGGNLQKYALRMVAEATGEKADTALEAEIDRRSRASSYPVGGGVLLAVLFLTVVSFLFFH